MLGRSQIRRAGLVGAASLALAAWSCSSSDSHTAARTDAGAAGQAAEAGAQSGGEPGSGGSTSQGAGASTAGTTGASGDASGATGGVAGGATGGVSGASDHAGAAGQDEGCVPLTAAGGEGGAAARGASRVLYTNDFETPNVPLSPSCGNSLDPSGINVLYGSEAFVFQQVATVEGVVIHDAAALYSDPSGVGKNYALGMLASYQTDLLALTFDVTGHSFLNVGFDLSAIDVYGCGGPFTTDVPVMQVRLYDTPGGTFSFDAPGTLLAQGDVTGVAAPDQWTFAWSYGVVSLDATAATGSALTVVFDLLQSGYGAFDNLSIVAADSAGVVDQNNDGIPDDQQCQP